MNDIKRLRKLCAQKDKKIELLKKELKEYKDALSDCHRVAARGPGHGTAKETANCIIGKFIDYRVDPL